MAKKDEGRVSYEDAHARLAKGDNVPAGWCLDFDRDPYLFECGDEEVAVAMGDMSVSWDGAKAVNLKTGQLEEREARPVNRPVTLQEMNQAPVAATGADTVTTGNAPASGRAGTRTTARVGAGT